MDEHIHILSDLHPSIALADYIRDIKTSTSLWLKQQTGFEYFKGWADGYAALTYSFQEKEMIVNYIRNQQKHHKKVSFKDEYRQLLNEHGVIIDEKYFL
jgi:REP element-mobilizing transposase RayT